MATIVTGSGSGQMDVAGEERDSLAAGDGEELGVGHAGVAQAVDGFAVCDDGCAGGFGYDVRAWKAIYTS
jgi:hypothetical protein